jgi:hypothetical protein
MNSKHEVKMLDWRIRLRNLTSIYFEKEEKTFIKLSIQNIVLF